MNKEGDDKYVLTMKGHKACVSENENDSTPDA